MKEFLKGFLLGVWNGLAIIGLLALILALCGCNAKNIERKEWNAQGQLISQTRMGQVNFGFWFGLSEFEVESEGMTVKVGRIEEMPDPNTIQTIMPLVQAWMGI